jgi:hypothetical protein
LIIEYIVRLVDNAAFVLRVDAGIDSVVRLDVIRVAAIMVDGLCV